MDDRRAPDGLPPVPGPLQHQPNEEVATVSDADNQMGGSGGDTGAPPETGAGPAATAAPGAEKSAGREDDDAVTEGSKESFPASDPPANY